MPQNSPSYAIVEFLKGEDKELKLVVPVCWIRANNKCLWPISSGPSVNDWIIRCKSPSSNWTSHDVKIWESNIDNYKKAKRHLGRISEGKKKLETDVEPSRQRIRKQKDFPHFVLARSDPSPTRSPPDSSKSSSSANSDSESEIEALGEFAVPTGNIDFHAGHGTSASSVVHDPTDRDKSSDLAGKTGQSLLEEQRRFQEVLLKKIASIEIEVKEIKGLLLAQDPAAQNLPEVSNLPLNTTEDFQDLCVKLQREDLEEKQKLIRLLSLLGGETVEIATRRVLSRIIGTDLARLINFTGKNGKICFKESPVYAVVTDSVRRIPGFREALQSVIEKVTKSWFLGSGDRGGGREERREKAKDKGNQKK